MPTLLRIGCLVFVLAIAPCWAQSDDRLPVPNEAKQKEAAELVQLAFSSRIEEAATPFSTPHSRLHQTQELP